MTGNQGFALAPNATLTGNMGMDAPFGTAVARLVNLNGGGNFQFVTPNGNSEFWAGGNEVADAWATGLRCGLGYGYSTAEGSNAKQGTGTLSGGSVTVANTAVTVNSRIFLTAQSGRHAGRAVRQQPQRRDQLHRALDQRGRHQHVRLRDLRARLTIAA